MKLYSVEVTGRPIETWPGQLTEDRRRSQFKSTWSATLDLLGRELFHLKAEQIVMQLAVAARDIRRDGFFRADVRPDHPGVILSMNTPYGALSYPCDTFDRWQDNVRAIALALQYLRGVERYGVTKTGQQYTGWAQLPPGRPMAKPMTRDEAAAFVTRWADPHGRIPGLERTLLGGQMIEASYRSAAKNAHPDREGGSTEDFQRLQEAKHVLDGAT